MGEKNALKNPEGFMRCINAFGDIFEGNFI